MASRRTRIKGIANIPQRRKTTATNDEHSVPEIKHEDSARENLNLSFNIDKIPEDKELHLQPQPYIVDKLDTVVSDIPEHKADHRTTVEDSDTNIEKPILVSHINSDIDTTTSSDQREKVPFRRRCLKPTVSASVIKRKLKEKTEEKTDIETADKPQSLVSDNDLVINDESIVTNYDTPEKSVIAENKTASDISKELQEHVPITTPNLENDITLDNTHITPHHEVLKPEVPLDKGKKLTPCLNSNNTFDIEYPPPPPSPSKINRSRIKAIPKLSNRKTSFSASESEDESRRNYNRNRNDSVCSTTSGITEVNAECASPQRPKEFSSIIQKKCNRTEQSRKLAEARREFQRRFGNNKPDRQRLTMIDLIFYNPTTNPMKEDTKSKQVEFVQEPADMPVDNESEKVDDPQESKENDGKSDEENEMPVPQIKIGPSGEIILDEKSLVIESKEVKKQREELQKTQLVDGDFNTSYGIYKRQKRSKNWTQNETLRFYKALNTIGTDFTLMCELFPRRTRRELKMKFKKEEKINRSLINRAIMEPCSFDFVELKHEVDMEERELEELQKLKEDEAKLKKEKPEKVSKKRKVPKDVVVIEEKSTKDLQPKPPKLRKVRKPRIKKLSIESVLEDSDADESDIATQSESEDEISMPLRPTRSGRVPKVAKKFDCTEPTTVDNIRRTKVPNVKTDNVEPGSIIIITEKGPNGEPVYKIYMVTPDQNAAPLNLTSDVVSKAIELKKGLPAQNIMTISANVSEDEAEPNMAPHEENNVTIPADENVTTLKGDPKTVIEQCSNTSSENTEISNTLTADV